MDFTHSSNECSLGHAVIENECKFSTEISHDLVRRIRPPVPQGLVGFYDDGDFVGSLVQPVLLLQERNVLDAPLKQAKYVVHNSKQSAQMRMDGIPD